MEWFAKGFVKASLCWLALGVTLGVAMAVHPPLTVHRPVHAHLNLLGFVTMMIYGVAYHVIPRFTAHPLHSRRLAGWHWWVSNVGLTVMVGGFLLRPHIGAAATPVLGAGGVLSALGAYAFVCGMWRTLDGPARLRKAEASVRASRGVPLPTAPGA